MFRVSHLMAGLVALAISATSILPASAGQWVLVGQRTVERNVDRDTIQVGGAHGRFDALRFSVFGNRVAVADVKVIYRNGTHEHLPVREHIQPGQTTVAYDLKGEHRIIERIEMLYQTEAYHGPRATMQVYGLRYDGTAGGGNPGWPGEPGLGWQALGTHTVSPFVDHDTVRVGAIEGRFRAIRLDVHGGNIDLYSVRVTFRNGEEQELPFGRIIYAGGSTGALDLSGNRRTIEKIDLVYKSRPSFAGLVPKVTVFGLH